MTQSTQFDLLLKTIVENEKEREAAEERTRTEYWKLKKTVEAKIPVVEKVEELSEPFQSLSDKIEQLEGTMLQQVKATSQHKN